MKDAERAYLKAVEYMTHSHLAYFNLGNLYVINLGRPADAMGAYESAIELIEASEGKMFSPKPYLNLGLMLKNRGNQARARRLLEVAARHDETRRQAREALSELR